MSNINQDQSNNQKNIILIVLSLIVLGIVAFAGYKGYDHIEHHHVPNSFRVSLKGDYTDSNGKNDIDATRYLTINKGNIIERQNTSDEDADNSISYKIDKLDKEKSNIIKFYTHQNNNSNNTRTFEVKRYSGNHFQVYSDGITTNFNNGNVTIKYNQNNSEQQSLSYVSDVLMGVNLSVGSSKNQKVTLMKNKDNDKYTFDINYTDDISDESTDMGDAYIIKVENNDYYNYVYIFKDIGEDDTDIAPNVNADVVYGNPAGRDNVLNDSADKLDKNFNMINGPQIKYNN